MNYNWNNNAVCLLELSCAACDHALRTIEDSCLRVHLVWLRWIGFITVLPSLTLELKLAVWLFLRRWNKQTFNPVKALMMDQRNESTRVQGTYESIRAIYWLTQMQLCHWKTYPSLGNNSWKLNPWSSLHEFAGSITGQRVSCMRLSQW